MFKAVQDRIPGVKGQGIVMDSLNALPIKDRGEIPSLGSVQFQPVVEAYGESGSGGITASFRGGIGGSQPRL